MSDSGVSLNDLQIQATVQREIIAIQQRNIRKQQKKLSLLERNIQTLSFGGSSSQLPLSEGGLFDNDDDDDDSNDGGTDESSETRKLTDAIFDLSDGVFRCSGCSFEVVGGFCQACGMEFNWDLSVVRKLQPGVFNHSDALNGDRSRIPRGTTPLLDMNPFELVLPDYNQRKEEFRALRQRGATSLMCQAFHLEFSEENGIFAWADEDIYEQFAGPAMLQGDFWKIHLGRRIELDEEDLDGSMFIEGLLEDVLLYPFPWSTTNQLRNGGWETIEESPGIWVTRLMSSSNIADLDGESEGSDVEGSDELFPELWNECPMHDHEQVFDSPPVPNAGPVVTLDEYELSSSESEGGSDVEMIDDSGSACIAGIPDAGWNAGSADEVIESDANGATVFLQPTLVDEGSGSNYDSDFDSDELLSGDEDVLKRRMAF